MIAYMAQSRFSTGQTMRRREFIALVGASVTWPFAALAQQPGRSYRLGGLLPLTRDAPVNVAFLEEFRRRGFIEGQNFTVEWRAYGLHFDLIRNMRPSWSMHGSMSSRPQEMRQFALYNRRRRPFPSLGS